MYRMGGNFAYKSWSIRRARTESKTRGKGKEGENIKKDRGIKRKNQKTKADGALY